MSELTAEQLAKRVLEDVEVRPGFYQASAFFPMPVVVISTRGEDGATNLAPYSNLFPFVAGKEARLSLGCRADSKTSLNLQRTGRAAICFIPDDPDLIANCKVLAKPAPTAEKMAKSVFTLLPGAVADEPEVVAEAIQVFECRWDGADLEALDDEKLRFVLQVERIRMQARWKHALEEGRGAPNLPVDYGFRSPSSSWLSRSHTRARGPRLRPRFEVVVPREPDEILAGFKDALREPGCQVTGGVASHHVSLSVPPKDATFWSPHLEVEVEPDEEGSRVRARIGPHPHVWTMFIAMHAVVAFFGIAGAMYGLSSWVSGDSPWPLWAVPIALFLHVFVAGAAFIGQGLGADQIYRLRSFMDEVLSG